MAVVAFAIVFVAVSLPWEPTQDCFEVFADDGYHVDPLVGDNGWVCNAESVPANGIVFLHGVGVTLATLLLLGAWVLGTYAGVRDPYKPDRRDTEL